MFLKDSNSKGPEGSLAPKPAEERKAARSGVPSIISPDLKIVGDLKSSGDIQVDGTVEGDINSRLLTIGQGARIDGSIVADTVRVSGSVNGQIKAKSVTLDRTAKVTGDVIHESLTMEAGAFLEGGVRRVESAAAKVSPLRPAPVGGETSPGDAQGAYG